MSSKAVGTLLPFTGMQQLMESKERAKDKAAKAKQALAESERLKAELEEKSTADAELAASTLASEQATLSPEEKEAARGLRQTKPTIRRSLLSEDAARRKTSLI